MAKEECGVVACVLKNNKIRISSVIYNLLLELQHRGQTSSGFSVYSPKEQKAIRSIREVGKVSNLFKTWDNSYFNDVLDSYCGKVSVGHVRYATSNVSDDMKIVLDESQPFVREHGRPWKRFSIVFNGHLTNYKTLRKSLVNDGYSLDTNVDTEVIMHLISISLNKHFSNTDSVDGLFDVFHDVYGKLDGSFSFVFMNAIGDLVVSRDSFGFRPLVIGENEDMICVASESKALTKIGISNFRDVKPGEVIVVHDDKIYSKNFKEDSNTAHCHFEYVYFSDACSINDGVLVDGVRARLGVNLGKEEKLRNSFNSRDWVVIPVPSTAIPAAVSYSSEVGLPINFALIKADAGRGFINSGSMRKTIMDSKYNIVPGSVSGKKVLLFDDSIVRGETSARVIKLIREAGAKEVHFRVTEAPIKFPCCYGVDFPSFKELAAGNFKGNIEDLEKDVAKKIGADTVEYISIEGLKKALGGEKNKFCFACLTGEYPTSGGCDFLKEALKNNSQKGK